MVWTKSPFVTGHEARKPTEKEKKKKQINKREKVALFSRTENEIVHTLADDTM